MAHYQRMVYFAVRRCRNLGVSGQQSDEDLVQDGNLGVLTAIEKFDFNFGNSFSTYAWWWIRQAVWRSISQYGGITRLPAHIGEGIVTINRKSWEFQGEHGRLPTVNELSKLCGFSERRITTLLEVRHFQTTVSLNQPVGEDGDRERGDLIASQDSPDPETETAHAVNQSVMERLLMETPFSDPARAPIILKLLYGLDGRKRLTLEETGKRFGLTRERIRQIRVKALKELKRYAVRSGISAVNLFGS